MPKCEGRPTGPCPYKKNDRSVHLSQGDLMLCTACENFRFPTPVSMKSTVGATAALPQSTDQDTLANSILDADTATVEFEPTVTRTTDQTAQKSKASECTDSLINQRLDVKIITDELLTYANFYRDKCTAGELHKVIVHFYLPNEISTSKRAVMREFETYLNGSPFTAARRQTSTRPACDAEIDDILGMLETLDALNVLKSVQFVAAQLDRLPKYGPNEVNVCTVVDRQHQIDQEMDVIKDTLQGIATNGNNYTTSLATQLAPHMDMMQRQLDKLNEVCNGVSTLADKLQQYCSTRISESAGRPSSGSAAAGASHNYTHSSRDVSRNVIVTGVAESRNPTEWCDIVTAALRAACGREVKFDDAIRLGKFVPDKPPRPILVKLCSPWDKRIVVGGAWRLKDNDQLRRVYIRDDLPLSERRRNLLERLQYRATRDGHTVSVSSDGVLVIDGINTFSLQDGFIQPRDHGGRQ